METKASIEQQVNKALHSIQNMKSVELPLGFADEVMNKVHSEKNMAKSYYTLPSLLKIAAIITLIFINIYTLRFVLTSHTNPLPSATTSYISINDFVNDYGINDASYELVTVAKPTHP